MCVLCVCVDALRVYEKKQLDEPLNFDITLGRMRLVGVCYVCLCLYFVLLRENGFKLVFKLCIDTV